MTGALAGMARDKSNGTKDTAMYSTAADKPSMALNPSLRRMAQKQTLKTEETVPKLTVVEGLASHRVLEPGSIVSPRNRQLIQSARQREPVANRFTSRSTLPGMLFAQQQPTRNDNKLKVSSSRGSRSKRQQRLEVMRQSQQ